ncbi:germ cell-less protein-like 1 [Dysidea avara]|uniref:germ cell-less protein-like 1 n=1 Tax=Dysidea avara TaxID=196820 RepID=UPI0033250FE9
MGLVGSTSIKRPREEPEVIENNDEDEKDLEDEVEEISPRRKKIKTTSAYIYETFFEQGTHSDVVIHALDKEWKLHKTYLAQSEYFSSMFSGQWKESSENVISLEIPDPNIDIEALDLAFSSMYRDIVPVTMDRICPTVAAATMLQLDGLMQHCVVYMKENLCADSVVHFRITSSMYGMVEIFSRCNQWLKMNLLVSATTTLLKDLSCDLFAELLGSPDLFMMQVEMDAYSLAKKWLFLKLHPLWDGDLHQLSANADDYFKLLGEETDIDYLDTEDGQQYIPAFKQIRLIHVVTDPGSIVVLNTDRIIPKDWLSPVYEKLWVKMLLVDQRVDQGPAALSPAQFDALSLRCGRVLTDVSDYCWRWTGYSYGIDILVNYTHGYNQSSTMSVKRNTRSQPCISSVSFQPVRLTMLKMSVVSFSDYGEIDETWDSGTLSLYLSPDEEKTILTLDSPIKFPLYISVNMALVSAEHLQ